MIQKLTSLSMGKGAAQQAPNQNQTHNGYRHYSNEAHYGKIPRL